jgi:hypothetical protein
MSAGAVLGTIPGMLYAGLVGAVHIGLYGRWDRVPVFVVGCIAVGALFGLLRGISAEGGNGRGRATGRSPGG